MILFSEIGDVLLKADKCMAECATDVCNGESGPWKVSRERGLAAEGCA